MTRCHQSVAGHPAEMSFQPLISEIFFFRSRPTAYDHRWGKELRWSLLAEPFGSAISISLRTLVSDLEMLNFSPTASHLDVTRSSESWNWCCDEVNSTRSTTKSSDVILRHPNRTPSTSWLHRETLPKKVMKRIVDKGQPWQSPNKSDLLPITLTKLWHRLYSHGTSHFKGFWHTWLPD